VESPATVVGVALLAVGVGNVLPGLLDAVVGVLGVGFILLYGIRELRQIRGSASPDAAGAGPGSAWGGVSDGSTGHHALHGGFDGGGFHGGFGGGGGHGGH
jgi:hypothetical protein